MTSSFIVPVSSGCLEFQKIQRILANLHKLYYACTEQLRISYENLQQIVTTTPNYEEATVLGTSLRTAALGHYKLVECPCVLTE